MRISSIKALYFSATGTTETVVRTLAAELSRSLDAAAGVYDFTTPQAREETRTFAPEELVIVGVPVYAGRVPNVLLPYLKEKLRGTGGAAIPVVLFGNRDFDDALIELRNILEEDGLRTVAAAAFAGEHAFSETLAAGRPDSEDLAIAGQFAHAAVQRIAALERLPETPVAVRGETPLRPYYMPRDRKGDPVNILKVHPETDREKCTECGLCASLCPMGSIDPADVSRITGVCIKCCACVKKCPVGAKYYSSC